MYENLCMKVYLDDEKTHVDPCPHNGHSVGWTVMTETIVIAQPIQPNLNGNGLDWLCYLAGNS